MVPVRHAPIPNLPLFRIFIATCWGLKNLSYLFEYSLNILINLRVKTCMISFSFLSFSSHKFFCFITRSEKQRKTNAANFHSHHSSQEEDYKNVVELSFSRLIHNYPIKQFNQFLFEKNRPASQRRHNSITVANFRTNSGYIITKRKYNSCMMVFWW